MRVSLHIANLSTSTKVCAGHNDPNSRSFYDANMSRTRPVIQVGWYLREWMDTLGVNQAQMIERTDWSKTTASHLYNCRQDYNPALVKAAARALNIRDFELFMPPEEAFHIRRLRQAVEEEHRLRAIPTDPPVNDPNDGHEKNPGRRRKAG